MCHDGGLLALSANVYDFIGLILTGPTGRASAGTSLAEIADRLGSVRRSIPRTAVSIAANDRGNYDRAAMIGRTYCDLPTNSGSLVEPKPTLDSELTVTSFPENFNRTVTIKGVS